MLLHKFALNSFLIGYTIFYERLEKFGSIRIIDLRAVGGGTDEGDCFEVWGR